MRKLLSIFLLAAVVLPLVYSLFALSANAQTKLPVCCRRNGMHHCGMASDGQPADPAPHFRAPFRKCPYCPAAAVAVHDNSFAPPASQAIFAGLVSHPALVPQTEAKLRLAEIRSRHKRGPPTTLSL